MCAPTQRQLLEKLAYPLVAARENSNFTWHLLKQNIKDEFKERNEENEIQSWPKTKKSQRIQKTVPSETCEEDDNWTKLASNISDLDESFRSVITYMTEEETKITTKKLFERLRTF